MPAWRRVRPWCSSRGQGAELPSVPLRRLLGHGPAPGTHVHPALSLGASWEALPALPETSGTGPEAGPKACPRAALPRPAAATYLQLVQMLERVYLERLHVDAGQHCRDRTGVLLGLATADVGWGVPSEEGAAAAPPFAGGKGPCSCPHIPGTLGTT